MKNSRNERLSEHLMNVDEEIFANAYEIDDAEKLRKYIRTKNAKTKKPFYMTPAFRRIATIAACFVLIVGVVFSIPSIFNQGSNEVGQEDYQGGNVPPSLKGEEGYLTINSIAQLNYYAAIRMIADKPQTTGLAMSQSKTTNVNYGIMLLSVGNDVDQKDELPVPETTGPNTSEDNVVTPNNPGVPDSAEDIYYYSLDPNEPFYIDRVSMFQIELTDENGFLASKLGLGIVDVVITEDCIWGESLITFRNGENFYSCLTNGGGYDRQTGESYWDFSTHKYVEGFFIVKNLAQENYGFNIKLDAQGQAYKFNCHETENGGNRVDKNVKVVSSTVVSEEGRSFTVAELENYFNTGKMPDKNGDEGNVVPPESGDADTNKEEISKLIEIEKYSSMTKDGTTSIEVEYTYVGETETVYDFVIEDAAIIDSLMSAIFNMELEDFPDDRDFDAYYRMITVNQGEKSYTIYLFSVSSGHKSYLCQSQEVRDIIEQYIEDNLIK